MTEPTAPWRTSKENCRIENGKVYWGHSYKDREISRSATRLEMELWQICESQREKLRRLVEAARLAASYCSTPLAHLQPEGCAICNLRAAIAAAEEP